MALSSDALAAFLRVADTGSVSRAAQALGVGKSVVSKRVALLEATLGTLLFARSTRRIALTPAGEAYLEHARRALAELAAGEERLRGMQSELTGLVRLTAPVSWGQRELARVLARFLHLHPGIQVELQLTDRRVDLAYERMDVALRWTPHAEQGLHCVPVAHICWLMAAAPVSIARHGSPTQPEDLTAWQALGYWTGVQDDHWLLEQDGRQVQLPVRGRLHADNPEAVREAALAGLGVALLPDYLCHEDLASGRLVKVLPDWQVRTRFGTRIHALVPHERLRLPRNRLLLEFLCSAFADPQVAASTDAH